MKFDLAVSYTWIYDIEFTQLIEKMFQENGLSTFLITRSNIDEVTQLVKNNELSFGSYLDRASDVDYDFAELAQLLTDKKCRIINEYQKVNECIDKSRVQQKLIDAGLNIPPTYIIPPYEKEPTLRLQDSELTKLGIPFIIKPAYYSGGGDGVKKYASSIGDIVEARQNNTDDSYLVQQKIYPKNINGNRAWFRVLWLFGNINTLLWNDESLLYSKVNVNKIFPSIVREIEMQMKKIYSVAGLDYFSSEFALNENDELFLIDYVNDQCDMRLKSKHADGVPDFIVETFVREMFRFVKNI